MCTGYYAIYFFFNLFGYYASFLAIGYNASIHYDYYLSIISGIQTHFCVELSLSCQIFWSVATMPYQVTPMLEFDSCEKLLSCMSGIGLVLRPFLVPEAK